VPESTTPLDTFHVREPAALRAVAHPLRQRILMELMVRGHARAADLAEATGEPANSISFHLRVLAKVGMIVESPEHARDKRDRVWSNAASSYRVEPGAPGEMSQIVAPTLAWLSDIFTHRADTDAPEDEPTKRSLITNAMLLTKEEASQFAVELEAFVMRWSDQSLAEARSHPEVARDTYQVLTALGPQDHTAGPEGAERD
jgi:DNA-binding transcriptional ArsR family regulator